jgi:uncharacterized protein (DUF433 family)
MRCWAGVGRVVSKLVPSARRIRWRRAGVVRDGACIRGLRITVETVVRLVAAGWSFEHILTEYPNLERPDIQQALEYAAAATDVHLHPLRSPA